LRRKLIVTLIKNASIDVALRDDAQLESNASGDMIFLLLLELSSFFLSLF